MENHAKEPHVAKAGAVFQLKKSFQLPASGFWLPASCFGLPADFCQAFVEKSKVMPFDLA
jgi:hypothetical protein